MWVVKCKLRTIYINLYFARDTRPHAHCIVPNCLIVVQLIRSRERRTVERDNVKGVNAYCVHVNYNVFLEFSYNR